LRLRARGEPPEEVVEVEVDGAGLGVKRRLLRGGGRVVDRRI
jgi:hypothetical protein